MNRAVSGLLLLCATLLGVTGAMAQEPTASLTIAPNGELTVGDPVELRVAVTHEPGDSLLMDNSVLQIGGMEPSAPVMTEISETETLIVFQTRAFAVGVFDVELPPITIQRADRSLTEIPLPSISITITSVLGDETEPRPLTDPDLLQADGRTFAPWIVAIIGIGLGFILARVVRRRYRRPAPMATAISADTVAPLQVSFELDPSLEAAEQCRQLASAVRSRLSSDWALPASALTSSEIGPALAAAGASSVVVLRVTRLLEACDRVQYGGEQPTPERLNGYVQLAEAIWSDGEPS